MKSIPWFTIATLLTAAGAALAGMAGGLDADTAAAVTSASVVLGGIGKAIFNIGEGLKSQD